MKRKKVIKILNDRLEVLAMDKYLKRNAPTWIAYVQGEKRGIDKAIALLQRYDPLL